MNNLIDSYLDPEGLTLVQSLTSPVLIQSFLDSIPYSAEDVDRCPLQVIQDRKGHCLDGALFAAAALRRLGFPPLVVDLLPEPGTDDDHVLAIYKIDGYYGAVAKSNYVGLRYREPVYRTLRELVMSYFEQFFNVEGQKTLRSYTLPVDLTVLDHLNWTWQDDHLDEVENYLNLARRYPAINLAMAARLAPVDRRSFESGLAGSLPEGLYRPSH